MRCKHRWSYEQVIWSAGGNDRDGVAVGRYCSRCGALRCAVAKRWRTLPKGYVDMREAMTQHVEWERKQCLKEVDA